MVQSDPFPEGAVQAVAAGLAGWLEASELPAAGARFAEPPLSVWDVKPGPSLNDAAKHSGEWHHQISNGQGAFAYLRTRAAGEHVKIIELAESPLTGAIETALRSLQDTADDSVVLRLLHSEQHHTTCLWIHRKGGTDEVIALQSQSLRVGERFDERSFLVRLASLPPSGMIATAPRGSRCHDVRLWGPDRARPARQVEI
jgi:hypothetical protein